MNGGNHFYLVFHLFRIKSDFDGTYIKKINKYSKIIGKNIFKK